MPDQHHFEHRPDQYGLPLVRCIDCGEGGPGWVWTAEAREQHRQNHIDNHKQAVAAAAPERLQEVRRARDADDQRPGA